MSLGIPQRATLLSLYRSISSICRLRDIWLKWIVMQRQWRKNDNTCKLINATSAGESGRCCDLELWHPEREDTVEDNCRNNIILNILMTVRLVSVEASDFRFHSVSVLRCCSISSLTRTRRCWGFSHEVVTAEQSFSAFAFHQMHALVKTDHLLPPGPLRSWSLPLPWHFLSCFLKRSPPWLQWETVSSFF